MNDKRRYRFVNRKIYNRVLKRYPEYTIENISLDNHGDINNAICCIGGDHIAINGIDNRLERAFNNYDLRFKNEYRSSFIINNENKVSEGYRSSFIPIANNKEIKILRFNMSIGWQKEIVEMYSLSKL